MRVGIVLLAVARFTSATDLILTGLPAPIPYTLESPDDPASATQVLSWTMTLSRPAILAVMKLGPAADPSFGTIISCQPQNNVVYCQARGGFSNGTIASFDWPDHFAAVDITINPPTPIGAALAFKGPGDFNEDGNVDVVDLIILVNEALGLATCTDDLTGDGACNISDVEAEIQLIL